MRAFAQAPSAGTSTHGNGSTFSFGLFTVMLVCAAAFLGIGAPAASAAAEATPGYGYLTTVGKGEFANFISAEPRSPIAIGDEGKVFVVDIDAGLVRVYITGDKGAFPITTATGDGTFPADLAVDPTDDTLYLVDYGAFSGTPKITRLLSDGKPKPSYTPDPGFELPPGEGAVVDPASHDLLVAGGGAEAILRYDTSGSLVDTIATPGLTPQRIALAEDGSIYVSQESTTVTHLSSTGAVLDQIDVGDVPKSLAIDWTTGAIVVGFQALLRSYSPAGDLLSVITSPTDTPNMGAAVDPVNGRLYAFTGKSIDIYRPGLYPGVENFAVSDITSHSAHIRAEIETGTRPLEGGSGEVRSEYSADGGQTWQAGPFVENLQPPGAITFEGDLSGLLVNTDYLVRLRVKNLIITRVTEPIPFSTPEVAPEVLTGFATDIGTTSAVLNGTVNPAGLATTYHFEWGLTSSYGSRLPIGEDAPAGATRAGKTYRYRVTGLEPSTTYHYRIVAENSLGTSEGADRTFTTSAVGLPQRFFEQITPANKQGNPLDPGIGFYAREDGNAFSYLNRGGDSSSPNMAFAMSRRGATDWESGIDLTDPVNVTNMYPGALIGTTLIGISPDFSHIFLATNKALAPGASENGTNLYVKDLATGAYSLVAGRPDPFGVLAFISVQQQNKFLASAPDLSWVVFYSPVPLLDGASGGEIYRWSESDGLEVVSILPNGDSAFVEIASDKQIGTKSVSADGSRVYFTAPFSSEVGVFLSEEGKPTKSISVSHVAGDPATSLNARLLGVSKDGRYAFFAAAEGKLTDDAPGTQGDVYRYDADDDSLEYLGGKVGFSAYPVIDVSDDGGTAYWYNDFAIVVWRNGALHQVTAEANSTSEKTPPAMSANGRFLGYEVNGGLFLYDAEADESSCASCLPDGTVGNAYTGVNERYNSSRFPRAVTEDGALFFTSAERLLATDTNGLKDVYMFKDGRPSLISPGNGPFEAIFGEVTPDGSDVFFSTAQQLVGRDDDESTDIYDARIGGGLAAQSPPPPQECLRDDCKDTPSAGPELPFGGSEALAGPTNVAAPPRKKCGKGKRAKKIKGKVRCVKKHKANKARKGGNR